MIIITKLIKNIISFKKLVNIFQLVGTADRTNNVNEVNIQQYAKMSDVCVKLDISYLISSVMKVRMKFCVT